MNNRKREYQAQGKTVDAAIEAGLAALGVPEEAVDVEIVDEGSRGLLGIGSRDAVVRLTVKQKKEPTTPPPPPKPAPAKPVQVIEEAATEDEAQGLGATAVTPSPAPQPPKTPAPSPAPGNAEGLPIIEPDAEEAAVAKETLETLLEQMGVTATISLDITKPDDLTGERINLLDVQGQDLRILIGPRGDTLNALQYITRLMVSHKLQQRTNFVIDVEGYRHRREAALSKLAERMAQKVLQRKRPISLEPMPPYERRVIHMTLRNNAGVYTQSVGEGRRRKVRILPK